MSHQQTRETILELPRSDYEAVHVVVYRQPTTADFVEIVLMRRFDDSNWERTERPVVFWPREAEQIAEAIALATDLPSSPRKARRTKPPPRTRSH